MLFLVLLPYRGKSPQFHLEIGCLLILVFNEIMNYIFFFCVFKGILIKSSESSFQAAK